ncbi:M48 family metallopeptidase [Candidatus Saccharibacteria bacterium]|nr:M48 family metallopeptidase [Candidatus Saccharibacteria bacterium]
MATLSDEEFGEITIRKSHRARHVKISVAPDGRLRASMPAFASTRGLKRLLSDSRDEIRQMLAQQAPSVRYEHGMQIGKSHSLLVVEGATLGVARQELKLVVTLPPTMQLHDNAVQDLLREHIRAALRREAKHYLPRRLEILARQLDCQYERVRFSHASSRWGSCSTRGTISLNIALMQLPFELIDYVLIHELCHTKQMNHSQKFWELVAMKDPEYISHRRSIKKYSPTI